MTLRLAFTVYQRFVHGQEHAECHVPALGEQQARQIIAKNHWSGKDPGWTWMGVVVTGGRI